MPTLHVQLSEEAYAALSAEARERGRSVEAAASDRLEADYLGEIEEIPEGFWTPEILASLDAAVAEADQGGGISLEEMRAQLAARSQAWRGSHPA